METHLYTLMSRGRPNEVLPISDGRRALGILPPVWALWNGLWISFAIIAVLLTAAFLFDPIMLRIVWGGLLLLVILEGGEIERLELRLRGWKEVGVVEARSEEGAEEQYWTGQAAT